MKNSDEYNEVVTILNCGFEQGRPVIRATKDNPDKVQILPVYGPKVFATRRRFKDAALEARCLTEIMEETDRDDIPPVLGQTFFDEQGGLRDKLLLFRLRNYFKAVSYTHLDVYKRQGDRRGAVYAKPDTAAVLCEGASEKRR